MLRTPGAQLCVLACIAALAACTSRYAETYQPSGEAPDAGFVRSAGEPRVERASEDIGRDVSAKYEDGYGVVGQSAFLGLGESESGAISQARQIGAAVVLLDTAYKGVVPGVGPIHTVLPVSETEALTPTADEFSRLSYLDLQGTSPFYGRRTVYTRTLGVYSQRALYFEPLDRTGLGALLGDQGRVTAVRKDSPAARADIRAGDMLVSVGGRGIGDRSAVSAALAAAKGKSIEVALTRDGARITRTVTIPAGEW
jgi:PDZ domain-containing protein